MCIKPTPGTNVLSAVLWLSLALSALGTLGVDTKPLLSLVGISGITLGLSVKDILSDTYAGIFVLVIRPFKRGSHIEVAGFKGKVLSTNIRYVRLLR
ncbi:Mechanosensitive ion channel MscS [Ochromonadaceae sp. CCMP2298]|nr:Mechanosensitive ion channel MscS [Ochromonadaceae sp. CCMP2298]